MLVDMKKIMTNKWTVNAGEKMPQVCKGISDKGERHVLAVAISSRTPRFY